MPRTATPRNDVPLALAAALVALLLALFVPLAHRVAAWPESLTHLRTDDAAVLAEHRRALALPRPPAWREALRAWDQWSSAAASGDSARSLDARHRFAELYAEASATSPTAGTAIRALAAERFLNGLSDPHAPLTRIAARHGLAPGGPWYATPAARLAWFSLRWVRNAAPTHDDGAVEPIVDSLARLSPASQRAFVSWALDARCTGLIGATATRPLTPDDVRACAAFRKDLLPLVRTMDPSYPVDEAFADTDAMLAAGLRATLADALSRPDGAVDEALRARVAGDTQAALVRARDGYAAMLERHRDRRIERRFMAVVQALSEGD